MRVLQKITRISLSALALLAGSVCATTVPSGSPIIIQSTSSLPGITPTSIGPTASAVPDLPTFGSCRAFYYDPKNDVPCGIVARQFTIFLTYPEYDQPSTAQWCEVFLNGNGICRATSQNSPSAFPTSRPSTLSISTVVPTPSVTTSSSDATGSPVPAIVSGGDSVISVGSPAATVSTRTSSTRTSSRGPVVLASVRGSEFSKSVHQTGVSATGPIINTTRMISYAMGHGNVTSFKTVLVTAHIAADAATVVAMATSAGVLSMTNSTRAIRRIRARRQASLLASSTDATWQVVNAEPASASRIFGLLSSSTAPPLSSPVATSQQASVEPVVSPAASVESVLFQPISTSLHASAATSDISPEPTSSVASAASEPWTSWSTDIAQPSVGSVSAGLVVGADQYVSFHGDETSEQRWPLISEWMTWDDLVAANRNNLASACTYWQVKENSVEETDTLLGTIVRVAGEGGLDPRVLLAMVLQESHGCLRVPSTMRSHKNTGILQSHVGDGSCNINTITTGEPGPMKDNSLVWDTCPSSQIDTMVRDGALGTSAGGGVVQLKNREQSAGYQDAQMWYRVARAYNSGSVDASNNLEVGAATPGYASDIANRLTGWRTGLSQFA